MSDSGNCDGARTYMFFWRAKKDQAEPNRPADDIAAVEKPSSPANDAQASAPSYPQASSSSSATTDAQVLEQILEDAPTSNVVTLTPSRLTDRLAQTAARNASQIEDAVILDETALTVAPGPAETAMPFPGQKRALDVLHATLSEPLAAAGHVLVLGPPGTGRRSAVAKVLAQHMAERSAVQDWVYFTSNGDTAIKAFVLPAGVGPRFARDVEAAIARAAVTFDRLLLSDDYAIGRQLLEEELKQAHDSILDDLKRRAESQNIALVKTPDGFVLAPMHDGRVVKTEVFRALPEGLQREVEAKIASLEQELKSLISQTPEREAIFSGKLEQLNREVAIRSIAPVLGGRDGSFGSAQATQALAEIEDDLIQRAATSVRTQARSPNASAFAVRLTAIGEGVAENPSPAIVHAFDVGAAGLVGELGRDGEGSLVLRPGALLGANGGFLIVEAWRLAAAPGAWATLSAVLDQGFVTPSAMPGLVVRSQTLPVSLRLIVIADPASWQRLQDIDPGIGKRFAKTARFSANAQRSEVKEAEFSELVASLAHGRSLRGLEKNAARPLLENAERRAGKAGEISLDLATLVHILADADQIAGKAGASEIRSRDIDEALKRRGAREVS